MAYAQMTWPQGRPTTIGGAATTAAAIYSKAVSVGREAATSAPRWHTKGGTAGWCAGAADLLDLLDRENVPYPTGEADMTDLRGLLGAYHLTDSNGDAIDVVAVLVEGGQQRRLWRAWRTGESHEDRVRTARSAAIQADADRFTHDADAPWLPAPS